MGLEQLPEVSWPKKPASSEIKKPVVSVTPTYRRVFGGLVWPEEGYPGFLCVLAELSIDVSRTFDVLQPTLEVVFELSLASVAGLPAIFPELQNRRCGQLYTDLNRRYTSFVRDFNRIRRQSAFRLHLKQTRSSSLESALLKVKDLIGHGGLKFQATSAIRSQLSSFSKADLKNELPYFAVRSLGMVIEAFKPGDPTALTLEEPAMSSWY